MQDIFLAFTFTCYCCYKYTCTCNTCCFTFIISPFGHFCNYQTGKTNVEEHHPIISLVGQMNVYFQQKWIPFSSVATDYKSFCNLGTLLVVCFICLCYFLRICIGQVLCLDSRFKNSFDPSLLQD